MLFHSFLDFQSSFLLLVILSRWVCVSPSTVVSFHHHHCWLLFLAVFLCFLIAHECDYTFGSLLTSELLCWAIILLPYNPPRKPAYGLDLCSGDDAVDGGRSCSDTAPLSPLLALGIPPVKNWPGLIIRQLCADSVIRWEHPQDMASTSLWQSTARLFSMPQPLGNRGMSLINSSGRMQVLGVEGKYESAAVFTGR